MHHVLPRSHLAQARERPFRMRSLSTRRRAAGMSQPQPVLLLLLSLQVAFGGFSGFHAPRRAVSASAAAATPVDFPGVAAAAAQTQQHRSRVAHNGVRMQEVDFYASLGLGRGASDADIKKAYRSAARKWHPDVNQEPGAKEKFQEINEAYSVLSDPQMKSRYDQFGVAGVRGAGGGGPSPSDFDIGARTNARTLSPSHHSLLLTFSAPRPRAIQ